MNDAIIKDRIRLLNQNSIARTEYDQMCLTFLHLFETSFPALSHLLHLQQAVQLQREHVFRSFLPQKIDYLLLTQDSSWNGLLAKEVRFQRRGTSW